MDGVSKLGQQSKESEEYYHHEAAVTKHDTWADGEEVKIGGSRKEKGIKKIKEKTQGRTGSYTQSFGVWL